MSDKEALLHFERKPVSSEMVQHLVDVTNSLIKLKENAYPSPPSSPTDGTPIVSLYEFIRRLIKYSNVQTPTLMSTLVYLIRLKKILPSNVYGIETTRHRIFLGCLILSAKFLNDSSPINKHWAKYTDGLLSIQEVNTIERELLEYLNWDMIISNNDLIQSLSIFLIPIKQSLQKKQKDLIIQRQEHYLKSSNSSNSIISNSSSSNSIFSNVPSLMSASSSRSTLSSAYSSSNSINQSYVKDSIDSIDYYTVSPTKPLKIRNLNDDNRLIKSNKSFNLLNAGRITQPTNAY